MATILSAIEEEIGNITTKKVRFEFADLEEANATIFDQIKSGDFPVCLILPFDIVDGNRENGTARSSAEINALFLDRVSSASLDSISSQVDSLFVAPMRALAREFVNRLDENDIIDEEGISSVTYRSVHQPILDAHLFGCWAVFTIKFAEDISTCPPD